MTPEGTAFSGEVEFVAAETPAGWVGILPRHAPACFALKGGLLRIRAGGSELRYRVREGLVSVSGEGVTVHADRLEEEDA